MVFDAYPTGMDFVMFGTPHLIALGIILLINLSFIFWKKTITEKQRRNFRIFLAVFLWVTEICYNAWGAYTGIWSLQENLPLHACSVLIILSGIMLLTKNFTLYEIVYLLGLAGASQALLTPDVGIYGFPHFRFFTCMITHGAIITSAIYMTVVEGFRPTWKSVGKVLLITLIYAIIIFPINFLLGSNYLFINHVPETASLIDLLGPWPLYLLPLVGIAVFAFVLLYSPFAISDWVKGSKNAK
ncbi:MAG: TIGR02206 family membrane protein [Anaerolineales bacterium]|nr:TIGR02206 family membrane protein [Anaerolineales bacterium]